MSNGIVNLSPNLDPSPTIHTSCWDYGCLPCLPHQPITDTHPCLKNLATSHHCYQYNVIQASILSSLAGVSALALPLWIYSKNSSWRDSFKMWFRSCHSKTYKALQETTRTFFPFPPFPLLGFPPAPGTSHLLFLLPGTHSSPSYVHCFLTQVSHVSGELSPQLPILHPMALPHSLSCCIVFIALISIYTPFIHLVPSSADMRAMSCSLLHLQCLDWSMAKLL